MNLTLVYPFCNAILANRNIATIKTKQNKTMKTNKMKSSIKSIAACSLLGIVSLAPMAQLATGEVTAPVGYVKLTFNAESDTPFSLPMNRPKAYNGQVVTISGNVINIANDDLTASQLVYADGTQNEKYYLLFTTGVLEGRTFDVTANGTDSITVDPDYAELIPALKTDIQTLIGAAATDNFEIRPHWTLNTLFPDGANFPSSSNNNLPDGLLMYRTANAITATDIGVNISLSNSYFFFDNGTPSLRGWYPSGSFTKSPDEVVRRDVLYVYRNKTTTQNTLNLVGDVPLTDSKKKVKILADEMAQDNYMPTAFPIDTSLVESGIANLASFAKSTGSTNLPNGDIVQIYAYPTTGINPAPTSQYIYYDATGTTNDGWYLLGNVNPGQTVDDDKIFKVGTGYVIRKASDFENADVLNATIPYSPLAE